MKLKDFFISLSAIVTANDETTPFPTTLPRTELLDSTSPTPQELRSNIFCYFTNWSQYRANAKFFPEDLDPSLCTHVIYAFAKIIETFESNEIVATTPSGTQPATITPLATTTPPGTESPAEQGWGLGPTEWNDIGDQWTEGGGLYARLNRLRDSNPGLKTLISVGGANHNSTDWSRMVADDTGIDSFVRNSMKYVRQHGFDGIDLDWEYPAFCPSQRRCSPESDAVRFRLLCEKFRTEIDIEDVSPDRKMLFTGAVSVGKDKVDPDESSSSQPVPAYDPKHMTRVIHFT